MHHFLFYFNFLASKDIPNGFIIYIDKSAMSLPILEVLKPNTTESCCLIGQYILPSCIWLDGKRWMKGQLTWPQKDLIYCVQRHFQHYFSYIMMTSLSDGRSRSAWREPPTMNKQLINFITCGCESSALFFVIYKAADKPTVYWW